jgi:sterol desaturase/sphingolipid hydroxylase (fatty acid hydroxylase superfamily)
MSVIASLTDRLHPVFLSPGSHFSVYSLIAGFIVGFGYLAHRQWRRRGRVRLPALARAFFSRRLMLHRSTRADYLYFFVNVFVTGLFIGWFCLEVPKIVEFVQTSLTDRFGPRQAPDAPEYALRAVMTVVAFLAYEFGYWFDHYLKHRVPVLWETHKTHHTAERLTPWTVWRVHPLDSLLFTNIVAACVGLAVGVMSYAFGARYPSFAIDGANIFLVLFFFAYVHLQHSQIWIPFTGTLGKLLMSPAHHQIHHSIDPAHYNSNMGNALAIWDWLFGTLAMPTKENPRLAFGVAEDGVDPHSVTELLVAPFGNVVAALTPAAPSDAPAIEKPMEIIR